MAYCPGIFPMVSKMLGESVIRHRMSQAASIVGRVAGWCWKEASFRAGFRCSSWKVVVFSDDLG